MFQVITYLWLGNPVSTAAQAAILTLASTLVGSIVTMGGFFFDTTSNPNPGIYVNTTKVLTLTGSSTAPNAIGFNSTNSQAGCIKYGVNFVECYQEALFTNTGASFGASTYYNVASVTKPYTGSGGINKIAVNCAGGADGGQPVATNVSVDQTSDLTSSGTGLLSKVAIGTGAIRVYNGSGGTLWRMNKPYIKVSASAKVGASHCVLQVWSFGSNRR